MTVHLLKLCVGVSSVEELAAHQRVRAEAMVKAGKPLRLIHRTRQMPSRRAELCDGGSIFWIIKGAIQVRQSLLSLDEGRRQDGRKCCELVLDKDLVLVQPVPRRPFQGWRYLEFDDAPVDLSFTHARAVAMMPNEMRRELLELALI